MNRRNLRNYACILLAAVSGALEAPRLARAPFSAATAEMVGVPSAVAGAVTRVAASVTGKHVGFDTNVYPRDRAMAAWKQCGEYEAVRSCLSAPCRSGDSWSAARSKLLKNGWGLPVIYVAQQTWAKSYKPVT